MDVQNLKAELVSTTSSKLIHYLLKENRDLKAENQKLKDELALYRKEAHHVFVEPEETCVKM
jgi:regulator of replication initiation timing